MNNAKPLIFGHRGARKYAPENTIPAFEKAIELELDGVEFDVMSTADGVPVVVHDDDLKRLAFKNIHVHKTPYAALQNIDVGRSFDDYFTGEHIPALKDVLELFKDTGMTLNIELKEQPHQHEHFVTNVIETLNRYDMSDRVIISSFKRSLLYKAGKMAPRYKRSLLTVSKAFFFLDILFFANMLSVWGINPHIRMFDRFFMRYAAFRGFKVVTWTVNTPEDIKKCIELGVDAVITDDPMLAKAMMR